MKLERIKRVDLYNNPDDVRVTVLGQLGYAAKLISEVTGYSVGQVGYRLKRGAVKIKDYRNGKTKLARQIIAGATRSIAGRLRIEVEQRTRDHYRSLGWKPLERMK